MKPSNAPSRVLTRTECGMHALLAERVAAGDVAGLGFRDNAIDPPPPDCEHCEGTGQHEESLTLGELRLLVADWMTNPIVPAGELDEVVDSLKAAMVGAASKSQGLADPNDVGSWLRACQEAAEALRAVAELRPRARD